MQDSGHKQRPVVVLSSLFHNRLHGARVLIVPLSSVVDNTALHRFIISPNDTLHGRVIKTESNILFDYTSMISPKVSQTDTRWSLIRRSPANINLVATMCEVDRLGRLILFF